MSAAFREAITAAEDKDLIDIFGSEDGRIQALKERYLDPQTHLHETIHFWQGLSLPFVYMSAFWSLYSSLKLFRELNRKYPDLHDWENRAPPILDVMSEKCAYHLTPGRKLSPTTGSTSGVRLPTISPLDLIEAATSLTEWSIQEEPRNRTAQNFGRWSKRNSCYPEAVEHLTAFLNDAALAVLIFVPLCYEAFHTSNPVRAFWHMAETYRREYPHSAGQGGRQAVHFRIRRVAELVDVVPDDKADFSGADWDKFHVEMTYSRREFIRLTMPQVLGMRMSATDIPHPTLYTLAGRWTLEAMRNRRLRDMVRFPSDVSADTLGHAFETYQPPWTILRFDLPARTRIVSLGRMEDIDYIKRIERMAPGTNGRAAMVDMFTMLGAIRRATRAFYAEDMRLCPHASCPEFAFNYCNSWVFIHDHYYKCTFREHLSWLQQQMRTVEKQMEAERNDQADTHD
jgi:hypothetical protein